MKKLLLTLTLLPVFVNAQIITTIAGGGTGGSGGPATSANIGVFGEMAIDSYGNVIIAANNEKKVFKVDAITGIITTIGGTGTSGYTGDGGPATAAEFNLPNFAACDRYNNIYVSDHSNRIRKIDAVSGIVTTIAGNGIAAFVGDGGPADSASINGPEGIVFDAIGNLYFADETNARIRKIDTTGIITTIAGTGISGHSGDGGPATSANISPWGVSIDHSGNLFFTDDGAYVRKINLSTGIITTVVGYGSNVYNGDGIPATAAGIGPVKMTFDVYNNMYIGDASNSRVRMVDNAGVIHTIAGSALSGFSGDGGPATAAELSGTNGVEYFCGNIYIADAQNSRVRKVTYNTSDQCPSELNANNISTESKIAVFPNPTITSLTITSPDKITQLTITNLLGQTVYAQACNTEQVEVNVASFPAGMYFVRVNDTVVRKFVKS